MLQFREAVTAAHNELTICSRIIHGLDAEQRGRPVPDCPGWDVEALSRHLVSAVWAQAEAFHRARVEVTDQPGLPDITAPADELGDRVDLAHAHLSAAFAARPGDAWPMVPLPFAVIPAIAAVNGIVLEYGVHRRDLERALGRDTSLSPETCTAVLGLAGGLMPAVGRPAGDEPVAYRLVAPSATIDLVWDGKAWGFGDAAGSCVISGDDEAIALLGMGRISLADPRIAVVDPHGTAARFTDYFAGI